MLQNSSAEAGDSDPSCTAWVTKDLDPYSLKHVQIHHDLEQSLPDFRQILGHIRAIPCICLRCSSTGY